MTGYVLMPGAHYRDICDALRERTGSTELLRSGEIAQRIRELPEKEDNFWEIYQHGGTRANYDRAFAGLGWTPELFRPKYVIRPTSGDLYMTFGYSSVERVDKTVLDLSGITSLTYSFYGSYYSFNSVMYCHIDVATIRSMKSVFQSNSKLHTVIMENISPECTLDNLMFSGCSGLENLSITGQIGDRLNLGSCSRLTDESVVSVLEHLADLTGKETKTLTFHNAVGSRLTEEQKAVVTAKNWTLAY